MQLAETTCAFTDGSMLNLKGGAGVYIKKGTMEMKCGETYFYPTSIWECEANALLKLCSCFRERPELVSKNIYIFVDNLLVLQLLKATAHAKNFSMQHKTNEIKEAYEKLASELNIKKITFRKIKAHVEHYGNEIADTLANSFRLKGKWRQEQFHKTSYKVTVTQVREKCERDFKKSWRKKNG